jgi:DNA-binding XRE family transcriptional regulator
MTKLFTTEASNELLANYLRIHRRRAGISQYELGIILGYENGGAISLHEKRRSVPPLLIALAYEIVFQVSVSEIFPGLKDTVESAVEQRLTEFENRLREHSGRGAGASAIARKLVWLNERRSSEYN